jgi:uncharacterized protein DUF5919
MEPENLENNESTATGQNNTAGTTEKIHPAANALVFLGKISAPTGVVAVFCNILAMSPTDNAVVSLATMLMATTILLYHPISNKISSPIVIVLMILLATIFFFNYDRILFKDTGLVKYWKKSASVIGILPEKIKSAKHEIWFCGTDFHISSTDDRQLIFDKLAHGVRIRYLIFDPYSPNMKAVASDFDMNYQESFSQCLTSIAHLQSIDSVWNIRKQGLETPGELEIHLYKETPRIRAYIFDPDDPKSDCIYIPYLHKINSPELPAFQFKNIHTGVFEDYFESIKKLWQVSTDLKAWKQEQAKKDSVQ